MRGRLNPSVPLPAGFHHASICNSVSKKENKSEDSNQDNAACGRQIEPNAAAPKRDQQNSHVFVDFERLQNSCATRLFG
jgi:hypothetical protein